MFAAHLADNANREFARQDSGIVEMTLLLPQDQANRLAAAAQGSGLTVAQVLRRLIRDFTSHQYRRVFD